MAAALKYLTPIVNVAPKILANGFNNETAIAVCQELINAAGRAVSPEAGQVAGVVNHAVSQAMDDYRVDHQQQEVAEVRHEVQAQEGRCHNEERRYWLQYFNQKRIKEANEKLKEANEKLEAAEKKSHDVREAIANERLIESFTLFVQCGLALQQAYERHNYCAKHLVGHVHNLEVDLERQRSAMQMAVSAFYNALHNTRSLLSSGRSAQDMTEEIESLIYNARDAIANFDMFLVTALHDIESRRREAGREQQKCHGAACSDAVQAAKIGIELGVALSLGPAGWAEDAAVILSGVGEGMAIIALGLDIADYHACTKVLTDLDRLQTEMAQEKNNLKVILRNFEGDVRKARIQVGEVIVEAVREEERRNAEKREADLQAQLEAQKAQFEAQIAEMKAQEAQLRELQAANGVAGA